ncbi:MAG: phasin family protein [Ardenticatenaceae bacterium]|nr:phasin family protein [Ardenticatenaceae bacterium]
MTKNVEQVVIEEEVVEENAFPFVENAQKVAQSAFYASLGAADAAREEVITLLEKTQKDVADILDKFISRGEKLEADGRKQIEKAVKTRRKQVDKTVNETTDAFEKRVEKVLHGMNVPSKNDIDALSRKIATLTKKVNALAKETKAE